MRATGWDWLRWALLAGLAMATLGGLSTEPAHAGIPGARKRVHIDLVQRLEELGRWCGEQQLYGRRAALAKEILAFAPEHADAHRWLKHRRTTDGDWEPPTKPYTGNDHDSSALEEFAQRHRSALDPACAALLAVFDEHRDDVPPSQLALVADDLVRLRPDEPRFRRLTGEVLLEDRWVLEETATGRRRHAEIQRLTATLEREAGEPAESELSQMERRLRVPWEKAYVLGDARAAGTVGERELLDTAVLAESTAGVFRAICGSERRLGSAFQLFVFTEPRASRHFLGRHPHMTARARSEAVGSHGFCVPLSSHVVLHSSTRRRRAELAVRYSLVTLLRDAYRIRDKTGWVLEGFSSRFCEVLVGSKMTWLVPGERFATRQPDLANALYQPGANWRGLARDEIERDGFPELALLLNRELSAFEPRDALFSYVLASYLLDGRPDDVAPLLTELSKGTPPLRALEKVTGLDLTLLERRIRRWLGESVG